jgi:hypothetical protein
MRSEAAGTFATCALWAGATSALDSITVLQVGFASPAAVRTGA